MEPLTFDFTDHLLLSDDHYDYDSIVQHPKFANTLLINGVVMEPLDDRWVTLETLVADSNRTAATNYRSPWTLPEVWKSVPRIADEMQFLKSTHDVTCALFIGLSEVSRFTLAANKPYAISVPIPVLPFHEINVLVDRECDISAYEHFWPDGELRHAMRFRRLVSKKLECMFWDGMAWPLWNSKDPALMTAVEEGCNVKG